MKRMKRKLLTTAVLGVLVVLQYGCAPYFNQPTKISRARLGEETAMLADLRRLPPPKEKLVAAVYKFRDQTGQYKPSDAGANWSTAVTQGATNILLKALDDSGWFVVIERENVSNLLNERKIVRSSLAQYQQNQGENLPPLLFGGIILEGGIVSYDANIITGGAGLRYFGSGGSTQYRQDRVTVYLRAVATKSGKILKTIYTSKTILSQSVDGGVFKYVRFKRLLEAETGFTTNEPAQMAVTEAIEKAVQSLVIEGIKDNLWTADATGDTTVVSKTLLAYDKEKTEMESTDIYGISERDERPRLSIQGFGSALRYQGDYRNPRTGYGYGMALNVGLSRNVQLQLATTTGNLRTADFLNLTFSSAEANLIYRTLPFNATSPFVYAGGGVMQQSGTNPTELTGAYMPKLTAGLGIEQALGRKAGFVLSLDYNHMLKDDQLDGAASGRFNDYFLRANAGLRLYIGRSPRSGLRGPAPDNRRNVPAQAPAVPSIGGGGSRNRQAPPPSVGGTRRSRSNSAPAPVPATPSPAASLPIKR
jgi:curli production assembly/transport component CsgG